MTPGGGQSIVVPNGNGTSTIIHPNGTVETMPTPKLRAAWRTRHAR